MRIYKLTELKLVKLSWLMMAVFLWALVSSGAVAQPAPEEWPSWRGPQYNMSAASPAISKFNSPALRVVWKKEIGSAYSPVSIAAGKAVTLFSDGEKDWVVSFDAATGEELWRTAIDSTYIGHDGSHDGPIAAPAIANGMVFAVSPWGELAALDLQSGKLQWRKHLKTDFEGVKPWYGFSSAPLVFDQLLILQTGGPQEKAVSAFDIQTGNVRWQAVFDTVTYQSPLIAEIDGRKQIIAVTDRNLVSLNPENGEELWRFSHLGGPSVMGAGTLNPTYLGEGRFLMKNQSGATGMFKLATSEAGVSGSEIWSSERIKRTYDTPVYHDGIIYGFNSRILTAIEADSGKQVWRSRPPGDGFNALADGHLISVSKKGHLTLAAVSNDGYQELDRIELFEDNSWTSPSFAYGKIYARSFSEIACVKVVEKDAVAAMATEPVNDASAFMAFLKELPSAENRSAAAEAFLESQKEFPIIDGNTVHFIYRGAAKDVAIIGDLVGDRFEQMMTNIDGTNLFYYSAVVKPGARLDYAFVVNYEDRQIDSLNNRQTDTIFGPASWFAMPGWQPANYLLAPEKSLSTIDTISFESEFAENRRIDVYLPAGYADGDDRFPTIYMHWGDKAQEWGQLPVILDNLIGSQMQPAIVVFVPQIEKLRSGEWIGGQKDAYAQMIAEELVPFIDENYRTIADPAQRLNAGMGFAGYAALYGSFKYPGVFGNISSQSAFMITYQENQLKEAIATAENHPVKIFLEWAHYDYRSDVEGWGAGKANVSVTEYLKEYGYQPKTNIVKMGSGWGSWKHRAGDLLIHFFPKTGK